MKQLVTTATILFWIFSAYSQSCTDLFFSEYCEGSGNNKGIELYNPTAEPIDLGPYAVQRWSNGANAASDETDLVGTIEPYGTWVLINGQTEDIDLGGGLVSPAVDQEMQTYADQLDDPYPAPMYVNGNDALVLVKNGNTVVDIFGKPGEDPGTAWTDNEEAGYTAAGGGTSLTANITLRRKAEITNGTTLPPAFFYALAEWDSLPSNTWDGLGYHECNCPEAPSNECSADYDFGDASFGISPDPELDETFELGCINEFYSDTIHLLIPSDAGALDPTFEGVPVDSMTLASVELIDGGDTVLPLQNIGLSVICNNNNDSADPCTFVGGNQYCALIEGMPEVCGEYQLVMTFELHLSFLGQTLTQVVEFDQFVFNVECDCGCQILGCTDDTACNYNPDADCDDGSCDYGIAGCTDDTACNYNPDADCIVPCIYDSALSSCDGECNFPFPGDSTCFFASPPDTVCLEPVLIPDNPGSCVSFSFNVEADESGSLVEEGMIKGIHTRIEHSYLGDLAITVICPNGQSTVLHQQGGGATYLGEPIDDNLSFSPGTTYHYIWSESSFNQTMAEESVDYSTLPSASYRPVQSFNELEGCPIDGQWTLEICDFFGSDDGYLCSWQPIIENSSSSFLQDPVFLGCTDPNACNYDEDATTDDGSCLLPVCSDINACNFIAEADCIDNSLCTYPQEDFLDCQGNCLNDVNSNGICDEIEVPGCTFEAACNYNPLANVNDSTCFFATAVYDCQGNCQQDSDGDGICDQNEGQDGSQYCGEETVWDPVSQTCIPFITCPSDLDDNGIMETNDLLLFLTSFGQPCP